MQMRLRSGGTEGLLAEKLEALITQTRAKQAATMSEVEWRGRTVPVKIDKVRIFLLGLADNEAAIVQAESEETKERLFETVLSECRDALQAVREELKPDQVRPLPRSGSSPRGWSWGHCASLGLGVFVNSRGLGSFSSQLILMAL